MMWFHAGQGIGEAAGSTRPGIELGAEDQRAADAVGGRRGVCLVGAAPDTGNMGVSALCYSILSELAQALPEGVVTVLDHGRGVRAATLPRAQGQLVYDRAAAINSRRYYRPDTYWNMRARHRLGLDYGGALGRLARASAVLDISGGDSFTDLYGARRFQTVALPKQLTLELGRPLVLMPQTYGPFQAEATRAEASRLVREATMAWARDYRSFEQLRELVGDAFDPARHRLGVDVAFLLERMRPPRDLADQVDWMVGAAGGNLIGLNVSGLLYHDPEACRLQYGLKADYRDVIHRLVARLLEHPEARLMLVPHVVTRPGHYESDIEACEQVATAAGAQRERIWIAQGVEDPRMAKWIIGRCAWFCGTRMHATIAALSSLVPTAAIAYSPKTRGVFETCGQGQHVADPRTLDTFDMVDRLWASFQQREQARAELAEAMTSVRETARSQMLTIAGVCRQQLPSLPAMEPA